MTKKTGVYLATAAVIVAAVVPAGLISAGASTTACGSSCTSPSVESLGTGEVLAVSGTSVVMSAASTTNSAEDFTVEAEGTVTAAVDAGVVSSKLMLNYSDSDLVEFQYAPDGVPSDECIADTSENTIPTNTPTLTVALQQCGITAASLWIVDQGNALSSYDDLINAGYEATYSYLAPDSNTDAAPSALTSPFAEPYVLTVNSSDKVVLAPLSELGGVISTSQAWTAYTAPDQSALRAAIKKSSEKTSG